MILRTVLGDRDPATAGPVDSHDHLFLADGPAARLNPALRLDDFDRTLAELHRYRAAGGGTVVDAQPVGCGRMAAWQAEAARQSGVAVIASTGFHRLPFYPANHWVHYLPEEYLTELFAREVETGMHGDGDDALPTARLAARAGVIKVAIGPEGPQGRVAALLRAAAEASLRTGAPLLCHTEAGQHAVALVDFLRGMGVPACSIIVCHADRTTDLALNLAIARTGVWLEYDTVGRPKYHSDEDEAGLLAAMAEAGHAGRLLLGLDGTRERHIAYGGTVGLDYLQRVFLPLLRRQGFGEALLRQWTIDNPAHAFSFEPRT